MNKAILMVPTVSAVEQALEAAYNQGRLDEREELRATLEDVYKQGLADARDLSMKTFRYSALTPALVIDLVKQVSGVENFLCGVDGWKRSELSVCRSAAIVMMRDDCRASYPYIARLLNYVDHTTPLYAMRTWRKNPRTVELIRRCREVLNISQKEQEQNHSAA